MRRIYYGWFVVATAMLVYAVLVGSIVGAFGIFVIPVAAELRLSRADINTGLIFKNLGNATFAPILGRLLDKVRAKPVMIVCAILYGVSMVTLGLSHSMWLSALVFGIAIPIAYLGAGSLTNSVLVARWFTAHRGRAMLLTGSGTSLGTMVAPPIIGWLVEAQGWRMALVMIGVTLGALLLVLALVVRERPGPDDVEPAGGAGATAHGVPPQPAGPPITIPALLRTPHFWMLGVSAAMTVAATQGVMISLVPLARDNGLSMIQATSLMSVLGASAIGGAILLSLVADRIDRVLLLVGLFLLESLLNALLVWNKDYPALIACAAILGLSAGTVLHSYYALLADRFGASSFGTVRGMNMLLIGAFGMVSVRFSGEVFDRTGGYDAMFATFVVSHILAALLMFSTRFLGRDAGARRSAEAPHFGPAGGQQN